MSLLMDALRKAEQEKREAAKRLRNDSSEKPPTDDNTPESDMPEQKITAGTEQGAEGAVTDEDSYETTGTLVLTPINEGPPPPDADESGSPDGEQQDARRDKLTMELADELTMEMQETEDSEDAILRQRESSLGEEAGSAGTVNPFNEEIVLGDAYEETSRGDTIASSRVEELELVAATGNQPTPVSAQTVFVAGGSTHYRSTFKWAAALGLMILAGLIFTLWRYLTPTGADLPSPMVAKEIESLVTDTPAGEDTPARPAKGAIIREETPKKEVVVQPKPQPSNQHPPAQVEKVVRPAKRPQRPPVKQTASSLPETIETDPSLIRISRSKVPDKRGELIYTAFNAYREGDMERAKRLYQTVLEQYPNSLDALLGLGAIALNDGDEEQALEKYLKALELDPSNSVAKTAIINLQKKADPAARESAIKLMLHDNPEVAFLHFALGNIYADQSRWTQAQQAFFNAYRYDSTNPDYAFNLAIALDRLGQLNAALDYYNTALRMASGKRVMFATADVIERIEEISSLQNP